MSPAPDRSPRAAPGREWAVRVEDALIVVAALALGVYAFRVPLGLAGWPAGVLLGTTLAVMAAVTVRRVGRLIRHRRGRAGSGPSRKDGGHAG
jgi:hypothetical protein